MSHSRLCVKNIPKYLTEHRLREHFAAKGEITDVKILKTKDGQSRQMAFIGFKSDAEAALAISYYNHTFMDTFRISVELARNYGDKELSRPWSRYSEGSSAAKARSEAFADGGALKSAASKAGSMSMVPMVVDGEAVERHARAAKKGLKSSKKPEEEDPKLAEFLNLMQPRSKAKIWTNDDGIMMVSDSNVTDAWPPPSSDEGTTSSKKGRGKMLGVDAIGGSKDSTKADHEAAAAAASDSENEEEYQDLTAGMNDEARWRDSGAAASAGRLGNMHDGEEDSEDAAPGVIASDDQEDDVIAMRRDAHEGALMPSTSEADAAEEGRKGNVDTMSDLEYLRSRISKWEDSDEEQQDTVEAEAKRKGMAAGRAMLKQELNGEAANMISDDDHTAADVADEAEGTDEPDLRREEEEEDGETIAQHVDHEIGNGGRGDRGMGEQQTGDGAGGAPPSGGAVVEEVDAGDEGSISETGRLFVRNLTYTATEAELSDLFNQFGDVQEVHLVLDKDTKKSKGIAYILYQIPEDAVKAHASLDMTIFQGRLLHILPAKRPPSRAAVETSMEAAAAVGFRAERQAQKKADAGNRSAWNSLFMRADTVAEAVAAYYGVSKSELLDRTASDLPVRMALGEAQVVAQTKEALVDAGVDTSKLEASAAASGKASETKSVSRSPNVLLVKNLPFSATEEELEELFGRCGVVARLVLPPSHTLALIEYTEPQDARTAFKALAYKKYQHVPLYLEWAPKDIFTTPPPSSKDLRGSKAAGNQTSSTKPVTSKVQKAGNRVGGATITGGEEGEDEGAGAPVASIYVKNLAFATSDASLKKHFDAVVSTAGGSMRSAKVARKKGPDGKPLSMGFGFVEVDSEEVAKVVIRKLQGSMLDSHKLSLQLSKARGDSGAAAGRMSTTASGSKKKSTGSGSVEGSTKLVVRNVAFEATRKDIASLFSPFGHLKSCRLPKKFDGSHRGFAFVDFVTKQEAKNAIEGVGGTHLYGRRLVVEYAQEEGNIDDLRAKTASKYRDQEDEAVLAAGPPPKRMRKGI
ncbi:hypothetical protein CEUSTIGMA_g6479.t1 [Chlamydomonas eustigma]|uniref:RRM domain-containing protein n=1 Tax=Chlamydomonas eustigma TaxID=1157962 RepID=A0A250X7Z1_9CHLO|nr:hypothetical protein CEUSTIGMA_g6479.t1 [Chlamydomonas eustigma]|eukprot:GAX79039.1 hypothetical protein CEUSTIGMA_g6479.t1 [Chlamydomonas eustigma]